MSKELRAIGTLRVLRTKEQLVKEWEELEMEWILEVTVGTGRKEQEILNRKKEVLRELYNRFGIKNSFLK